VTAWTAACSSGHCVEVAFEPDRLVAVRNSADPATVLRFTHDEWVEFLLGVGAGTFDIPVDQW
jgi:hypothetical protein